MSVSAGPKVYLPAGAVELNLMKETFDPRITFTRASTKTYIGPTGSMLVAPNNTWPVEYDPVTKKPMGRSVWETKTNLEPTSSMLTWSTNSGTVTRNTGPSVMGAMDATLLGTSSAITGGYIPPATDPLQYYNTYSLSMFFKPVGGGSGTLTVAQAGTGYGVIIDLATKTISQEWAGIVGRIDTYGDGWYRLILNRPNFYNAYYMYIGTSAASAGCYVHGWQVELGGFVSPYIPTTGASATRATDVAIVENLPSLGFNTSDGTIYCDATIGGENDDTMTGHVISFAYTTDYNTWASPILYDNRVWVGLLCPNYVWDAYFTNLTKKRLKVAQTYTGGAFVADRAAANGVSGGSAWGVTGTLSPATATRMGIGVSARYLIDSFGAMNGHIRRVVYWPTRLSEADLIAITRT